jgi:hypothetical protein
LNVRTIFAVCLLAAAFALPRAEYLMTYIPKPQPEEQTTDVVIPEKEVWNDLADWCDAGQVTDTDELLRIAKGLKTLGKLTDISRLDKYTTNGAVTPEVVETLRK